MRRSIDLCIPFISAGIKLFEYYLKNINQTAKYFDRIKIYVSYHSHSDLEILKNSCVWPMISKAYLVPPHPESLPFYQSANHSSAINKLAANCNSEIMIFSDYDMAFLHIGWDEYLDFKLAQGIHCLGISYPNLVYQKNISPTINNVGVSYYQKIPNLSFFCINQNCYQEEFKGTLTNFDIFLMQGGLPCKFINHPQLATATNLPIGSLQWLDTGWEIPEVLFRHKLKSNIFERAGTDEVIKILKTNETALHFTPEYFYTPERTPFIAHFVAGSHKMKTSEGQIDFVNFTSSIDLYLSSK